MILFDSYEMVTEYDPAQRSLGFSRRVNARMYVIMYLYLYLYSVRTVCIHTSGNFHLEF